MTTTRAPVVHRSPKPGSDVEGGRRRCPVCASASGRKLHRQRYALFDDSALPSETVIQACDDCGMVFAASDATAEAYRRHYRSHSKYEAATASGSGGSESDVARLNALVDWLGLYLPLHGTILDVGAGGGGLMQAFRRSGRPRVVGLDPSPGCVAAMHGLGLEAHVGDIETLAWPIDPRRFDLVVLSHVLEHVYDVAGAFAALIGRATPFGRVYIECPDASRYRVGPFPPFYFFDPEHINHFDVSSLSNVAHRFGWSVHARWERDIEIAPGLRYPALGLLLGRSRWFDADATQSKRAVTSIPVRRYTDACLAALGTSIAPPWLDAAARTGEPLVVWGAGSHAQRLLAQTALGGCAIECIIDGDPGKQGRRLAGRPVVTPDVGLALAKRRRVAIAIAVAVGADEVARRARHVLPDSPIHLL